MNKNTHFRMSIGSDLVVETANKSTTGLINIGKKIDLRLSQGFGWEARIYFPGDNSAVINLDTGLFTNSLGSEGSRQQEYVNVFAPNGATADGNLIVTLTGSPLGAGSPVVLSVPLRTSIHKNAAVIAAAIAEKLLANVVITKWYFVTSSKHTVSIESRFGFAMDATLNLSITAGLGVAGVANSSTAATVSNESQLVIDRLGGGANKDAVGDALPSNAGESVVYVANSAESVGTIVAVMGDRDIFCPIQPGGFAVLSRKTPWESSVVLESPDIAIADIVVIASHEI